MSLEETDSSEHSASPALTPAEERRLDELVATCIEAMDSGERVDHEALIAENPRLGPALRAFLRDFDSLGRVTEQGVHGEVTLRDRQRLGDYEILEEVARGGMGVVYRARQASLDRVVALKVVLAGRFASVAEIERFRREATAAAALDHAHIVPIHDVGECDGVHYFTMRFIDGRNLALAMRSFPGRRRDAADLVATVADAVQHAHEKGVLHRDLKPANILLGEDGRPWVTDFGLARHVDDDSGLTRTGDVVGTPSYMSPEQASGASKTVDARADVYSLGAILYEMVAGRPPFEGATPFETLRQAREEEASAPRRWNPAVERDLETICLKSLEKDPRRRYPSAAALAAELRRFRDGETIHARPVSSPERAWRWCRRNPALAGLLVAIVTLLAVIAVGASLTAVGLRAALWSSYRDQARALRSSEDPQRRVKSLAAIASAVGIRRDVELRDEAIACLATTSLGEYEEWTPPGVDAGGGDHVRITVDADFERIAWADARGAVHVVERSLPSGDAPILVVAGPGRPASALRFGPDGKFLAVQYDWQAPAFLHVLEIATGRRVLDTTIVPDAFDFHPAEPAVVVAPARGGVVIHELPSGREVRALLEDRMEVHSPRHAPGGARIAAAIGAVEIAVVDLASGAVQSVTSPAPIANLAWDPRGKLVAVGCHDSTVRILDVTGRRHPVTLHGHEGSVVELTPSADGALLATASWDGSTRLWSPDTALELARVDGGGVPRFRSDGARLATISGDSRLRIWDIARGDELRLFSGVDHFDVGPGGRLLARADPAGGALVDLDGYREIQTTHYPLVRCHFSPAGDFILTWYRRAGLFLSRMEREHGEHEETVKIGPHALLVNSTMLLPRRMAVSHDGSRVAVSLTETSGHPLSRVAVLSTAAPVRIVSVVTHGAADAVALGPRGRWLATGTWHGNDLKIWEAESGELVHTISTSGPTRNATAEFSVDGRHLLTSTGAEYALRRTGEWEPPVWTVSREDPNSIPGAMAFSPDGRTVALCPNRLKLELRDIATGHKLATLDCGSTGFLRRLRFDPHGVFLWAARGEPAPDRANPGTLEVWNLQRVRGGLDALGLDWSAPPIVPPKGGTKLPLRVELDVFSLTMIALNPKPVVTPETLVKPETMSE